MAQHPPSPHYPSGPIQPRPPRSVGATVAMILLTLLHLILLPLSLLSILGGLLSVTILETGDPVRIVGYWVSLIGSISYPLVAIVAVAIGWVSYSNRRYQRAVKVTALPLAVALITWIAMNLM